MCRSIGRVRFCWLVSESRPLLPLIVCSESCIHPKFSTLMWQTKACLLKSRRNFTSCCFFLLARFTLYSLHISPSNSSCPHCQTHAKCLTAARIRRLSISRRRAQAFSICQSARPSSRTCTAPNCKISAVSSSATVCGMAAAEKKVCNPSILHTDAIGNSAGALPRTNIASCSAALSRIHRAMPPPRGGVSANA